MRNRLFLLLPFFSVVVFLSSCSSKGTKSEAKQNKDSIADEESASNSSTKIKLPSPVELYLFIREAKVQYTGVSLNPIDNASKYVTANKKAANFGVYASDLAYCTVYERQQESNNYFKTIKEFAQQLGINEGFDKAIVSRIDANLYNTDSLYQITNDSYWKVCNYLEENNKQDVLAPILVGGWIESLQLAINSVDKFNQSNVIVIRITEQRFLLENLLEYLKTLKNSATDKDIVAYMNDLNDLQSSFDKLYDNPNNVLITLGQYKDISQKVKAIRTKIIN